MIHTRKPGCGCKYKLLLYFLTLKCCLLKPLLAALLPLLHRAATKFALVEKGRRHRNRLRLLRAYSSLMAF